MKTFDQKYFSRLKEANLDDGTNLLLVTKWNASIGASYITTFIDNLFITPYGYGDCTKKTRKINKSEIKEILLSDSRWSGIKIRILLNSGEELKYSLVNKSWISIANDLISWSKA